MKVNCPEWIEWLPDTWDTRKIKNVASLAGRIGWQGLTSDEYIDNGAYLITGVDFDCGKINWDSCVHISFDRWEEASQIQIKEGDLLITKDGTVGKVAIATDVPGKTSLNSGVLLIRSNEQVCTKFLFWVLQSEVFWNWFGRINAGNSTIIHLYQHSFNEFLFPFPNKKTQQAIASDLDIYCERIDAIISNQEMLIEKLKEYKLSVITETVTTGLISNVKMRDSGIARIGCIPETWDVIKITRLLDYNKPYPIGDGDHGLIKSDDYKFKGIPYIRVQNLGWGTELDLEKVVFISEDDNERIKNSELHPGDVLFCKTGATIGKTGIIPKDLPRSNTTSHVGKITIDERYNPKFVFYFLSSRVGYELFWDIASMKSTRPELSIEEIKRIKIIIPHSRKEQDDIVIYLDDILDSIDKKIQNAQTILDRMIEYKNSIVYEMVTGKKEVCSL